MPGFGSVLVSDEIAWSNELSEFEMDAQICALIFSW